MSLGKIFRKGISPDWINVLSSSNVTIYDNFGIIAHETILGVTYINSGTKRNEKFTYRMTKDINKLIKNSKKVVIQCSFPEKFAHLAIKFNFRYNSDSQFYYN